MAYGSIKERVDHPDIVRLKMLDTSYLLEPELISTTLPLNLDN